MNTTLTYTAAALAAASATWSFATGNFWPGLLAVLAAGIVVLSGIRKDEA
ncbi:hypothetical protein [Microbacterium sp. MEJ108Y]|nr:hypothetical protein [Microbacterium sp. MEJ108Y]